MENTTGLGGIAERMRRPGFGPPPAPATPAAGLSRSRASVLKTLTAQPEPTSLAALAAATGLHVNTVREHLDALLELKLIDRQPQAPFGRGRPAWLYFAVDDVESSEYAGLAAALASVITRTSRTPTEDALQAGETWGAELTRNRTDAPAAGTAIAARRAVVSLLDELGFEPDADRRADRVRLTRCPLLEAARKYPEVVCAVHLGIVRSALQTYGGDPERTGLTPFAEPGACALRMLTHPTQDIQ